jgi:predicted nuclease of predicted toxin-antitoxin system
MSLRFLCDQCIPAEISNHLRQEDYTVILLREVLPIRSPDPEVITKAKELNAVLVSLNGDFSDIVAYPPSQYSGIIAIQLHNHPEIIPQIMQRMLSFLTANKEPEFYPGKLIIVEAHRIRLRQ